MASLFAICHDEYRSRAMCKLPNVEDAPKSKGNMSVVTFSRKSVWILSGNALIGPDKYIPEEWFSQVDEDRPSGREEN